MLWHHKTSPELYIGPGTEAILREQRKGPHAQMAFASKNNERMLKSLQNFNLSEGMNLRDRSVKMEELEQVNRPMARCHPDKPRATPDGKCLDCVKDYYARRMRGRV